MKNYIDGKVKRAIISYSASSIKTNDEIQGVVVTNTIGNYSNGDLTFLKDGIARFIINVSRNNVTTGDITFNLTYVEQGTLSNFIPIDLKNGERHSMIMNLIYVKKDGVFCIKSDSDISYLNHVLKDVIQF